MITLVVSVATVVRNLPIELINGKYATWEGVQHVQQKKGDRFAALNPSGAAEVRVGLEEKLNGPSGSYSSVTVNISITARSDQTEEAVKRAADVLFVEVTKALHHYVTPAYNLLIEHIEQEARK